MTSDTCIIVGQSWLLASLFYNGASWIHVWIVFVGVMLTFVGILKAMR